MVSKRLIIGHERELSKVEEAPAELIQPCRDEASATKPDGMELMSDPGD